MNLIIPFESRVKFKTNVKEICSISLEHEYNLNESGILGNFLISGTYKEHELSANILDYNFTVPFSVDITEKIDKSTVDFSIDNFTYDIIENEMVIKIDYIVSAENEPEIKPISEDFTELFEEEPPHEDREEIIEKSLGNVESYFAQSDDYDIYKVHIVKENDTIESICAMYNADVSEVNFLNEVNVLNEKDKLLIPIYNE